MLFNLLGHQAAKADKAPMPISIPTPNLPALSNLPSKSSASLYSNLQPYLSNNSQSAGSAVHVHVEGVSFQYTLTEDDLTKVFARYGKVKLVHVNLDGSSAVVHFFGSSEGMRAVTDLDGKVLNGVQGCLRVAILPQQQPQGIYAPVLAAPVAASPAYSPAYPPIYPYNASPIASPLASPGLSSEYGTSRCVRKYTARFEIGIDNDKDFHVARRIIGPKGANMKKIVLGAEGPETPKLRLRGIGSGFLEGALKQESPEPLHLCVSCKDYRNYKVAIDQVTGLLEGVYREYAEYLKANGIEKPAPCVLVREHPLMTPGMLESERFSEVDKKSYFLPPPTNWGTFTPSPESSCLPSPGPSEGWNLNAPEWIPAGSGEDHAHPLLDAANVKEIERLIEERNEARRVCNFKEADRIRDVLRSKGIGLMDEPGGRGKGAEVTSWRYWRK